MQRALSPEDLAADPIDRYWLGEHQLVWCRSPTACGSLHWGRPTHHDARDLTIAMQLAKHPALADRIDVLVDSSAIERVEWLPFARVLEAARECVPAHRIRRHAVVVGPGLVGAQVAPLVATTLPLRVSTDRSAAYAWLEWAPGNDAIAAVDEATQVMIEARRCAAVVHRLRVYLTASLTIATVDSAAATLITSARTLQRELAAAGTSFSAELHAARIRVAAEKLLVTGDKVEVIAREVGCASASRLAAIFRRFTGTTPAVYRERYRLAG